MEKNTISKIINYGIIAIIIFVVYKMAYSFISSYKKRNTGRSTGADDFSNMALDIYNAHSAGYDRDEVEQLSSRILALSNDNLMVLNDKFVDIYGDKCKGGGFFCNDTTSMKAYISSVWCIYGCKNHYALVDRLSGLGL